MNRCPGCDYLVPSSWTECRRCGSPLAFAQSPPPPPTPAPTFTPSPVRAPPDARVDTLLPTLVLPELEPRITIAPPKPPRFDGRKIVIGAVIGVLALGAAFTLIPHGGHHAAASPTILEPNQPFAGLPTSLSAIVRIEAESSRHTALSVVISAASPNGVPLTLTQLTSLQPGYQWMLGSVPSTTNTMISITSAPGSDVIAVSGTNRTICAYGRWSPAAGSTYVTMDKVQTCSAATAPANGWSTLPGGSAQDLPGVDGS